MINTDALTRRAVLGGAMALALPRLPGAAFAADAVDVAAAKKEGNVTLYTSAPIAAAQKVANAFQQKYGIKVELFRSGGTQVLRRFMMEHEAGRAGADVLVSSDPAAVLTSQQRACSCRSSRTASRRCRSHSVTPRATTLRSA
jgi:iron(III) transport system substrate-binding protein